MPTTDTDDNEPILEWCPRCDRPDAMCECDRTPNTTVTGHPRQGRTEPGPNTGHETEHATAEHRTPTEQTEAEVANTRRTKHREHKTKPPGEQRWWDALAAWMVEWGALVPIWFLAGALGVAGFAVSFLTVEEKARSWSPEGYAWLFPTGIDLGIITFTLLDIFLARRGKRIPWLRYVPWGLTIATIYLNVTAYTALEAQIAHAVLPSLWVVFTEAIARIMKLKAKEEATTTRTVPLIRWACAPIATFILWRAMQLWAIDSYEDALKREEERQLAKAVMKAEFGSVRGAKPELRVRYRQRKITVAEVLTAASEHDIGKSGASGRGREKTVRRTLSDRRSAPADGSGRNPVRDSRTTEHRTPNKPGAPVRPQPKKTGPNTNGRTSKDGRSASVRLGEALAAFRAEGVPNPTVRDLADRAECAPSTAHTFVADLKKRNGK
ncbi:DUF2637 domain-containing protein [Glycomyces buryatensis]|uniref:DUF2637 domain-containing protein n=1 Tax=Glycomyces buryatensis TaxID=2570927 RepID=A0A4S8Q868_9ACTN|nr:DUF2637 domain-containing protein [Glycomyces buryatensis]THV40573.1 DUF2637 domain-containing protein [Glycomyces buryatensis]